MEVSVGIQGNTQCKYGKHQIKDLVNVLHEIEKASMGAMKKSSVDQNSAMRFDEGLAEAVRFELTEDFHPRQFSRLVHSTALPSFL